MGRSLVGLAAWLAVTLAAATTGALFSVRAVTFYGQLARPAWAPPPWLFGPVWTLLYLAMAVAAWLVWARAGFDGAGGTLALYLVQLVLNAAWTWLFFGLRRGDLAVAEILLLWLLVALTLAGFWRVRPLAGALLVPYLLWVSFAAALTWSVWRRNPDLL